jgi:hypothetical protein
MVDKEGVVELRMIISISLVAGWKDPEKRGEQRNRQRCQHVTRLDRGFQIESLALMTTSKGIGKVDIDANELM